jgi:glucose/arabinose dehydrogenase/chitodextrinase
MLGESVSDWVRGQRRGPRPFSASFLKQTTLCVLGLGLWLALVAPRTATPQTFADPSFDSELVVSLPAFQLVGFTWAPDGTMFIWQKNGVVRIFHDGILHSTPFIDLSNQVNTYDDRGLLGLAVDPDFEQNGYVYLAYVYEPTGNSNDTGPKTSRISRVTANPADRDVALPGSEVVLIEGIPADSGSHNVGTLRFAADGTLFASSGDGGTAAFADPLALGAQDLNSYRGKILRINRDGSAPAPPQQTNPFYDGTNSIRSRVWAYGLRNPYRFDFHPTLGDLYAGEVGWNTWEEVDRIVAGGNYGWPCYEGANPQPDYQAAFPSTCGALPPSSVIPPLFTYDRSLGSAAVGGAFYTGSAYPADYDENFFFSDYTGNWIRRLVLQPDGSIAQNLVFATDVGVVVSMGMGPDGLLYYADFISGQVRRIRYDGVVAAASATPQSGYSPLTVSFSSAGSADGLGGSLSYLWNFGDGTTSTQPNPQHTYVSAGVQTFTATLTVTNSASDSSSASVPITVGSLPPSPVITSPADGTPVEPGQVVSYSGAASDPDDGALPGSALQWDILLHHNSHIHAFVGGTGATGSFTAEFHGAGTYSYELLLTATDSSGLKGTTSVNLPVLPDTEPPSVPQNLVATATGPSTISLTWDASTDNGAVSSYRVERCEGAACSNFAEVATAASIPHVDAGLVSSTAYSYRVRAEDASGNLGGYSSPATATTQAGPPPSSGLVAAWGMNEGTGTAVSDLSGNANTGTASGATWTTGRYGQALAFDGVDDVVVVPDSSSLDLSTGMTLEAWVYPTTTLVSWKAILQKQVDAYFLNGNTSNNRPGVGGTFSGACCTLIEGQGALPLNQWTHVAGTYDGAQLRLYVNGVQVASQARTGSLEVNAFPLRIGGNTYSTEFFPGRIDEVRIYNRALSAAEIAQDMNTPVGGAPSDTTPPARSNGLPTGVLAAGTTQATLSLATDEAATCRYGTTPGVAYASLPESFSTTGGTAHSTTVTGLANGQSYAFHVRCQDSAGNANPDDFTIGFSVATPADTTPPQRSSGQPTGTLAAGTTQTTLSLATDEAATCRYATLPGVAYASQPGVFSTTGGTAHSTAVTGLASGQSYSFYVRCQDAAGNANPDDFPISFSVASPADTTPPVVSMTQPASGAQVSGIITVAASASDDSGVIAGVQFLLDLANLGAEATAAPYQVTWDTRAVPNGVHMLSARARDGASNSTTSTAISVTVNNTAAPGLVAAWGMNEGSGSGVADASGNGNNGSVSGAVWAAGRYGQALRFDGVNDVLVIPDSSSLDLTTALTFEAWVYPTATLSSWKAILQKEVDAYFLNASTNNNRLGVGGTFSGVCCTVLRGPSGLTPNQWTHVAATYDGAWLRLYVNGVQVASRTRSGSLEVNALPLRIGGSTYPGEFFPGLIDEVRIYNRALSAAEISQDMATPVGP